jgi:HSP20 family protein
MSVAGPGPFRDPFRSTAGSCPWPPAERVPRSSRPWTSAAARTAATCQAGLPGAGPGSVEVTAEHGVLTIQAERTPHHGDSEQVIAAERPQEPFARQLSPARERDPENLTAGYADGVLHVTIPASPKAQARRLEVTRAAGGSRVVPGSTVEPGAGARRQHRRRRRQNVPAPCHPKQYRLFPRLEAQAQDPPNPTARGNIHASGPHERHPQSLADRGCDRPQSARLPGTRPRGDRTGQSALSGRLHTSSRSRKYSAICPAGSPPPRQVCPSLFVTTAGSAQGFHRVGLAGVMPRRRVLVASDA